MYKIRTMAAAIGLLAGSAAFAFVDETQGIYLGGSLGGSWTHLEVESATEQNMTGFAWGLAGGYKVNKYFALELEHVRIADSKHPYDVNYYYPMASIPSRQVTGTANFVGEYASKNSRLTAFSVKGMVPLHQKFNVFGKVGAAYVQHELTQSGPTVVDGQTIPLTTPTHKLNRIAPYFAAGAGLFVTNNIELIAQAATTTKVDNVPAMSYFSGGVVYHIGL